MSLVESVGKIANAPVIENRASVEGTTEVSFEEIFKEKRSGTGLLGSSEINLLSDYQETISASEEGPIGVAAAQKIVNLLEKTGFLDKVVDGIVSQSGKANWVNEGQRIDLKIELRKELEGRFSSMDWSEVFEFVLELSLKIKSKTLGPMEFDPQKRSDSVYNKLRQTMGDHLNDIGEKVAGTDRR